MDEIPPKESLMRSVERVSKQALLLKVRSSMSCLVSLVEGWTNSSFSKATLIHLQLNNTALMYL